jgi:hypothetical protein
MISTFFTTVIYEFNMFSIQFNSINASGFRNFSIFRYSGFAFNISSFDIWINSKYILFDILIYSMNLHLIYFQKLVFNISAFDIFSFDKSSFDESTYVQPQICMYRYHLSNLPLSCKSKESSVTRLGAFSPIGRLFS